MDAKDFAEAFLGKLASDTFHISGSLAAYLDLPDARRGGDEANIVDARITRTLLEALGYATAEINYNQTKDKLRPDYVVHIADYPGCCFVVEDKDTTEQHLEKHRPQLASYMTAQRSGRGLLVNGERLLGYDDVSSFASATLEFPLATAVRLWRGEDLLAAGQAGWEALPQSERDTLAVLVRRYGRTAFQGVTGLINDLTLDRDGQPHAADGSTWKPGRTRFPLVGAQDASDALVESIQELIGELRADVAVQYAAHQREYAAFSAEVERAPGSNTPADGVMEDLATRLLALLPGAEGRLRDAMRSRLRQAMRGERPEAEIDEVAAEVRALAGGQSDSRTSDALGRTAAETRAFAGRYGRHLSRARERHRACARCPHRRRLAATPTRLACTTHLGSRHTGSTVRGGAHAMGSHGGAAFGPQQHAAA